MENKIKEFIKRNTPVHSTRDEASKMEFILKEAIQFGSQLTAERAKEKVNKDLDVLFIEDHNESMLSCLDKMEVLQAIEDSIVKGNLTTTTKVKGNII